jgi:hypothetical protein
MVSNANVSEKRRGIEEKNFEDEISGEDLLTLSY